MNEEISKELEYLIEDLNTCQRIMQKTITNNSVVDSVTGDDLPLNKGGRAVAVIALTDYTYQRDILSDISRLLNQTQ